MDLNASSTAGREHGIAIVHHEPVRFVAGQDASKLLRRPLGRRRRRDIPMQNPTGADLQHQEHVHEPEMRYEFLREPSARGYRELVDFCGSRCVRVLLVVREPDWLEESAVALLEQLQPFQVSVSEESEWPGTTLLGHTATVHSYEVCKPVLDLLKASVNGLYEWVHPKRPEDLCFLRASGDAVLVSIAHEADSYLDLSDQEVLEMMSGFRHLGTIVRLGSGS